MSFPPVRSPYASTLRESSELPETVFTSCEANELGQFQTLSALGGPQVVILQRQRSNPLSRSGKNGVANRGRHPADDLLADPGDRIIGRPHKLNLDFRHLSRIQKRERVKIRLGNAAFLDRNFLKQS